jgi:hypothetical protein
MGSEWFNDEQVAHMKSLASIPREQRCASGWHVLAEEKCDCKRVVGGPDTGGEPRP